MKQRTSQNLLSRSVIRRICSYRWTRKSRQLTALFLSGFLLSGCYPQIFELFLSPPSYPAENPEAVQQEAQDISNALEDYIKAWMRAEVPREIPNRILPKGINFSDNQGFFLQRYEEINPAEQWAYREVQTIDFNGVQMGVPDPHVTYLKLGTALAPFGSQLVIEGEFPYARFLNIQITPPLDGKNYYYNREIGSAEVSIVDADIEPLPGHTNPFIPGANRNATNRKYQVTFDLAIGKPVKLNPSYRFPYRGAGNNRVGSLIVYQGPWGEKYGKGSWNQGEIWIRYYAPDLNQGKMAGIPFPKAYYQLPTGERYFINSDFTGFSARANQRVKAQPTPPTEPPASYGPNVGWFKSFGILKSIGESIFIAWNKDDEATKQYIREIDLGVTGRGEDQPPPGNYEPHATTCNYNTYIGRSMAIGKGKVVVLTGKLPTFPETRNGAEIMPTSQLRYWSISGYDVNALSNSAGAVIHSIMDDEIMLDANRNYVIVYSRPEDRPANATAENGVTWVNWGPISQLGLIIRWMSVAPHWMMAQNPHENNLPWTTTAWSGKNYNQGLIGYNNHNGFLGEYQPKIHYMTREVFETLPSPVSGKTVPEWVALPGNQ
jgi:hypothetical protein